MVPRNSKSATYTDFFFRGLLSFKEKKDGATRWPKTIPTTNVVPTVLIWAEFPRLTVLGLQSRFGDQSAKLSVVCSQNGTAVQKEFKELPPEGRNVRAKKCQWQHTPLTATAVDARHGRGNTWIFWEFSEFLLPWPQKALVLHPHRGNKMRTIPWPGRHTTNSILLRGAIVNRTYGTHKKNYTFPYFY